jgi:hypothetical protein
MCPGMYEYGISIFLHKNRKYPYFENTWDTHTTVYLVRDYMYYSSSVVPGINWSKLVPGTIFPKNINQKLTFPLSVPHLPRPPSASSHSAKSLRPPRLQARGSFNMPNTPPVSSHLDPPIKTTTHANSLLALKTFSTVAATVLNAFGHEHAADASQACSKCVTSMHQAHHTAYHHIQKGQANQQSPVVHASTAILISLPRYERRRQWDKKSDCEDRSCTIDNGCFELVERCRYVT